MGSSICTFQCRTESFTGRLLYSDYYAEVESHDSVGRITFLSRIATIPFLGIAAGVMRVALAMLHGIIHSCKMIFSHGRRKDHLVHVIKGAAEALRGVFEAVPIVGRLFAIWMTPIGTLSSFLCYGCPGCRGWKRSYSVFLIKLYHPEKLDEIDKRCTRGFPKILRVVET